MNHDWFVDHVCFLSLEENVIDSNALLGDSRVTPILKEEINYPVSN